MKQLLQSMRDGKTMVEEVPVPAARPRTALVRTAVSLVSSGTERMVVEFAEKSLIGKARSRPDLVRQLLEKARREGMIHTVQSAFNRLDQPMALGYSSAGTIAALGRDMPGFKVGQRVACAGGGYAVHAGMRWCLQPARSASSRGRFRGGSICDSWRNCHARLSPGTAAGRRAGGGDRPWPSGMPGGPDRQGGWLPGFRYRCRFQESGSGGLPGCAGNQTHTGRDSRRVHPAAASTSF
jgi:hypothetical protein